MIENKQRFISQIMTSKSPVRSCDDVDEAVLSYAEIKALCVGNPLIAEKVQLDIDVAKLKILRGDYQSQIYRLQDNLTQWYPLQIESVESTIRNIREDMERMNAGTHKVEDGISPMVISEKTYTKRVDAGAAILEARENLTSIRPETIGSYRGFDIDISFDSDVKEYKLHLDGRIQHTVSMGDDAAGNVTRLDNVLDKIPEHLSAAEVRLEDIRNQVAKAEATVALPFPQEVEYLEKLAKLAEVDAKLTAASNAKDTAATNEVEAKPPAPAEKMPPTRESGEPVSVKSSTQQLFDRLNNAGKDTKPPPPRIPPAFKIHGKPARPLAANDSR